MRTGKDLNSSQIDLPFLPTQKSLTPLLAVERRWVECQQYGSLFSKSQLAKIPCSSRSRRGRLGLCRSWGSGAPSPRVSRSRGSIKDCWCGSKSVKRIELNSDQGIALALS